MDRKQKLISEQELKELLQRLLDWNAMEIYEDTEKREILIPYVMNDAVESYLCLTGARMHGELDTELIEDTSFDLVCNDVLKGLIFRQASENTVSIWFDSAFQIINCYQYHLIGHAWRRESGEEYIRRLVNLICVLHDKKTYLGAAYCNETELWIADLAEFAPIIYYTPINESIMDWYPESQKGIIAVKRLAQEAGDALFLEELALYENMFLKGKIKQKQIQKAAGLLLMKDHAVLWRLIDEKIKEASLACVIRDYGMEAEKRIEETRKQIADSYREKGFKGEYPYLFHQKTDEKIDKELVFVEEQPFSVMEAPDFAYRIFSMIINPENVAECEWREEASFWHQKISERNQLC